MQSQNGFTLIELVITISLLGILAAVTVPKLFNITPDAQISSVTTVAAALSSANAVNYAVRTEKSTNGQAVANCTNVSSILQAGLPSGYTITAAAVALNSTVVCTVVGSSGVTSTFTATGIA